MKLHRRSALLPLALATSLGYPSFSNSSEIEAKPKSVSASDTDREAYINDILNENIFRQVQDGEPLNERTILETAIRNNPEIRAGREISQFVDLLSIYNRKQYTPKVSINFNADPLNREFDSELSLSQRFETGFSGRVFTTLDEHGDVRKGVEINVLIPGLSSGLANQRLADLRTLQEPAKERLNFESLMRGSLEQVARAFYEDYGGLNQRFGREKEKYEALLNLYATLETRQRTSDVRSDLDTVSSRLSEMRNLLENALPSNLRSAKRYFFSILGVPEREIDDSIDFTLLDVDYETALGEVLKNDPEIKRYWIELNIAQAEVNAARKDYDVSISAGLRDKEDLDVNVEVAYSIDVAKLLGKDHSRAILVRALELKRRSYEDRIRGRIKGLSNNVNGLFEVLKQSYGNMDLEKQEIERNRKAYKDASDAFARRESWVTLERVLNLLDDLYSSMEGLAYNTRRYALESKLLKVRMGKYDATQ